MNFAFIDRLGAGYFGEVWRATDLGLNAERAVKLIPPEKLPDKANFFREAQILKQAEHPNIVKVESAGILQDGRVFVAMEYLRRGSIDDEAKGAFVPLTRAKRVMIDILRGLEWAHGKGIIHHDIKPANILVGNANQGKLSDFGLAILPGRQLGAVAVKHYNYLIHLAPEAHKNQAYSVRSDIYACGVTLYRMVNGDSLLPPVPAALAPSLACSGKYPDRSRYRAFVPRPLKIVINKAMAVRPQDRYPSAEALRRALEQVTIEMNWSEQTLPDRTRWVAGWNDRCHEVSLVRGAAGTWSVLVRKGQSKHRLRRVEHLSAVGLPKAKAERAARRVLQDFVLGVVK
jgi:eukaryotic-like serine/threonine-protein kinase